MEYYHIEMFFFGAQLFLYSESSVFRILTIVEIALSCYVVMILKTFKIF